MARRTAWWASAALVLLFVLVMGAVLLRPSFAAGSQAAPVMPAGTQLARDPAQPVTVGHDREDHEHDDDSHEAREEHEEHDDDD